MLYTYVQIIIPSTTTAEQGFLHPSGKCDELHGCYRTYCVASWCHFLSNTSVILKKSQFKNSKTNISEILTALKDFERITMSLRIRNVAVREKPPTATMRRVNARLSTPSAIEQFARVLRKHT
ncbi:hypothetical protein Y032_0347g3152 [Ancylostoma ceylanicum]|uniref:Uncharacterized protein n=1 Tax=Ancylostoma ceylanicum TaxID=53326 RepID=A0A016RX64_9BILA|nr:hypothetical protein Y032_0347g3152 [Ancylostoma ceylanicum]